MVIDLDASGRPIAAHLEALPLALLREFTDDDNQDDEEQSEDTTKKPAKKAPAHTPDFATVFDGRTAFTFNSTQRSVVQILWEMRDQYTPNVSGEHLLEASGSSARRLSEVFRDNSAWGSLIVPGPGNTYYLRFADDPDPAEAG